jgi:hypothetical protein
MARAYLCIVTIAVLGLALSAGPGTAQFGGIFGAPPRPPSNVPSRPASPPPPQWPTQPQADYDTSRSQQGGAPIQTQPLPAPGTAQGAPSPSGQSPLAGLPPNQRQPRGAPPAAAAPAPPPDDGFTELPQQKIANPTAVFAGLDKITGRITAFDVAINETVQFGALQVTPRVCYTRPPTETPNTDSFIEVEEVTLQGEVKRIFTGWTFASSPGLHAVEHPVYDIWLTDCKGAASAIASATPATPAPRAPAAQRQQQQPNAVQQQRPPSATVQQRQPARPPGSPLVPPRN